MQHTAAYLGAQTHCIQGSPRQFTAGVTALHLDPDLGSIAMRLTACLALISSIVAATIQTDAALQDMDGIRVWLTLLAIS